MDQETKEVINALLRYGWNTDFNKFCTDMHCAADVYSEEKFAKLQEAVRLLNNVPIAWLCRVVEIETGAQ